VEASAAYTDGRPGTVPMRPLAIGEILDGAMALLRQYPAATLGLGALVMAVQVLFTVPLQWLSQGFTFSMVDPTNGSLDPLLSLLGISLTWIIASVITTVCLAVVSGFMASVVGDSALGHAVSAGSVWRQVRPRMWGLIGLSLIIGLAEGIGLMAMGVGWLFVTGVFAVAIPALVLERVGVVRAIGRSWDLTIRSFFRVLGIRLLAILVSRVLLLVIASPFLIFGNVILTSGGLDQSPLRTLLGVSVIALGTMGGNVLAAPFLGCVDGLLYLDRRMRSEGLDIQLRHRKPGAPVLGGA
jgi:hypothetical protein